MNAIIIDPFVRKIRIHRFKKMECGDLDLASNILEEPAAYHDNLPNADVLFTTEAARLQLNRLNSPRRAGILLLFGKVVILRFRDIENVPTATRPYEAIRSPINCVSQVGLLKKQIEYYPGAVGQGTSLNYDPNWETPDGDNPKMVPFKLAIAKPKYEEKYIRRIGSIVS